jgi:uncharacterized RDD family membrane protein YckC
MADGPAPQAPTPGEGPAGRPLPLPVRLLGAGVRGARTAAKATGIDRAVEVAAEEAMVAAVESEAVERALVRVLQGPVVEEAMQGALESESVKKAMVEALDSELVDEVWRRLLASDEAQRLVERIAEAPEVRAAISAQSVGFIEDIGRSFGNTTRRIDGVLERVARRILFRPQRSEPTERAGALTRFLAFTLDLLIFDLFFWGLTAIVALIGIAFTGSGNGVSGLAVVVGSAGWVVLSGLYFVAFWSLAGQTPGMRFFGLRLAVEDRGLKPRRSVRRLLGMALAAIPFCIGFLGILVDERRRGWQDRLADADVIYSRRRGTAPWSQFEEPDAFAAGPATSMGRGAGGLRPQQVGGPH